MMTVHRGILLKSSGFFKSAFKPEWASQRPDPNTFAMPEDSPEQVRQYISWRYTGSVSIPLYYKAPATSPEARAVEATEAAKVYIALAHAYVFGERILDNAYTNAVVTHMIAAAEASDWGMGPEFAKVLYDGTLPGCSARRLFADMVGWMAWDDSEESVGWRTFVDGYEKEMLVDIMKSVIRSRKGVGGPEPRPWEVAPGTYLEEEIEDR